MLKPSFSLLIMFLGFNLLSQPLEFPLEKNNYQKATTYNELSQFVKLLESSSHLLEIEVIGQSVQGRDLYALKFSNSVFGKDKSKIKVLFFAQQHGNEQSGKEGALLLAAELLKPENHYLFEKIDFALIPQVNPDGSEINKRRNANEVDLNRNHLILTEPEVIALHKFFHKCHFEVNLDVHEYAPYGEEWKKYGYRKNTDITLGVVTNNNISSVIRDKSNFGITPFFFNYVRKQGYSAFTYCPGGPPEIDYIRHSTFDINDGRQSFGILNSFSFIQEGLNGTDTYVENIKHRAHSQKEGMHALLQYIYKHSNEMKKVVKKNRAKLISGKSDKKVSIQAEHVADGTKLSLPLYSYYSGKDTLVNVNDYRPVVKSTHDVVQPLGYLIPAKSKELIKWLDRQNISYSKWSGNKKINIEQYFVTKIDSIDFEREIVVNPLLEKSFITVENSGVDYLFVPLNQLKSILLVLALEPKSMLGLVTYPGFAHLLKAGQNYPVLRVIKNKTPIKSPKLNTLL